MLEIMPEGHSLHELLVSTGDVASITVCIKALEVARDGFVLILDDFPVLCSGFRDRGCQWLVECTHSVKV